MGAEICPQCSKMVQSEYITCPYCGWILQQRPVSRMKFTDASFEQVTAWIRQSNIQILSANGNIQFEKGGMIGPRRWRFQFLILDYYDNCYDVKYDCAYEFTTDGILSSGDKKVNDRINSIVAGRRIACNFIKSEQKTPGKPTRVWARFTIFEDNSTSYLL